MKQTQRVLRALQRHPDGVAQPDFLLPNVIDGGRPITRLAARVLDLRSEGHEIVVDGEKYGCARYVLNHASRRAGAADSGATQQVPPADTMTGGSPVSRPAPKTLFDVPARPGNAILGEEAA